MPDLNISRFWTTERGAWTQLIVRFNDGRWATFQRIYADDPWDFWTEN